MEKPDIISLSDFCKSHPARFWQDAICLNGQPREAPVFSRLCDSPKKGAHFIMADGNELYLCIVTRYKAGYGYNCRTVSRLIYDVSQSIGGLLDGEYSIPQRFFAETQPTDGAAV